MTETAPEREVLCCGASTWGKVIAWLQIISNAILIVAAKGTLIDILYLGKDGFTQAVTLRRLVTTPLDADEMTIRELGYEGLIAVLIALIAISIISLFMGVILLQGVKQRHARYLKSWIIYVIICWLLVCMATVIYTDPIGVILVEGIFLTLVHALAVWVPMAILLDINSGTGAIKSNLSFFRLDEEKQKH